MKNEVTTQVDTSGYADQLASVLIYFYYCNAKFTCAFGKVTMFLSEWVLLVCMVIYFVVKNLLYFQHCENTWTDNVRPSQRTLGHNVSDCQSRKLHVLFSYGSFSWARFNKRSNLVKCCSEPLFVLLSLEVSAIGIPHYWSVICFRWH